MSQLVDLALSPESPHVVNFGALRSCLLALLEQSGQKDMIVSSEMLQGQECRLGGVGELWTRLETTEKAVEELKGSSTEAESLLKRAGLCGKLGTSDCAISDIWKAVEMDHRVAGNSNGIEKMGRIMDEMSRVIKETDRRQSELEKFVEDIRAKVGDIDRELRQRTTELDEALATLSEASIDKSLLKTYVTWTQLEESLTGMLAKAVSVEVVCQTDQSVANMRSRSVSVCSLGPSEELAELLSKIGSLASDHVDFIRKMGQLEASLGDKADSAQFDKYMLADEIEGRLGSLRGITAEIQVGLENTEREIKALDESAKVNSDEIRGLSSKCEEILSHVGGYDESIKNLESISVTLENTKACHYDLEMGLAGKADKSLFEDLLSLSVFRETVNQIEGAITGLNARLDDKEAENRLREAMRLLAEEVDSKLSKGDFAKFRAFLEKKMKDLKKTSVAHASPPGADEAAILNKRLATSFHCLSCGRPVNVVVHRYLDDPATRPVSASFPEMQASYRSVGRPYSSVRAKSKGRGGDECHVDNWWQSDHNCILNSRRAAPVVQSSLSATERPLIGKDGHVYKGRVNPELGDEALPYRAVLTAQSRSASNEADSPTHFIGEEALHELSGISESNQQNGRIQPSIKFNHSVQKQ